MNPEAMQLLADFQKFVKQKKATMLLLPPVYQSTSFVNQKPLIDKIYQSMKDNRLPVIAMPERYEFPDSLFFDTSYHLILPGIERRSSLLIEDLERALSGEPCTGPRPAISPAQLFHHPDQVTDSKYF